MSLLSLIKLGLSEVVGKILLCSLQNDSASIQQLQSIRHLITISKHLWAASLSLLLCREGQRHGDGFSFLPGVRRVSFSKTSKRAAYSCGDRANLCHLLKQPGSSSLLGELLILSLYDLTCVTVFCTLACRKCYLLIHSWRIISFYLWLLPFFGSSAVFFLSALNLQKKVHDAKAKPSTAPSLPPNVHGCSLKPSTPLSAGGALLCKGLSLSHWFHFQNVFSGDTFSWLSVSLGSR